MARFIKSVILVENDDCHSQLEYDTNVLSAAWVYMAQEIKQIFEDYDKMLATVFGNKEESQWVNGLLH